MKLAKRQSKNQDLLHTTNHTQKDNEDWKEIKTPSSIVGRRCCHSSCIKDNQLYIYGGYDSNSTGVLSDMYKFSMGEWKWTAVEKRGDWPGPRHSQTTVVFENKIYMFGGMVDLMSSTNQLHVFDLNSLIWQNKKTVDFPSAIDSHRACLYGQEMIIGMGYSQNEYNPNIYSINLNSLFCKSLFKASNISEQSYPKARAQGSFNLYKDSIIIYGGKDFSSVFQDIWSFDLKTLIYRKIQLLCKLQPRFGHSGVILQNQLFVFGGTKGVTHQRNDLVSIDLESGFARTCWIDSQEERIKGRQEHPATIKKSRRDSSKKIGQNQENQDQSQMSNEQPSLLKYRTQLKQVNYYNQLFESQKKALNYNKKTRRNPLLTELDMTQQNQSLNLTSTFQILTNSIMLMMGKSNTKEQKSDIIQGVRRSPKARDNYTADLYLQDHPQMIIFGGGMHKISYNDLIIIDLKAINSKYFSSH